MKNLLLVLTLLFSFNAYAYVPYAITSGSNKQREEVAIVAGGSSTSVCSVSPCTVYRPSSSWISGVVRGSAGVYTLTIVTGVFSAAPVCNCTTAEATTGRLTSCQPTSATSVSIGTFTGAAAASDSLFAISCYGPR